MKDRQLILTGGTGGLGTKVTQLAQSLGAQITIPYHSLGEVEEFFFDAEFTLCGCR